MVAKNVSVRCPRCGDKIELGIYWEVVMTQRQPGKKSFITLDIGSTGTEHTCN